jgi:hypothetical protein
MIGSYISGGLSNADAAQLSDPGSIRSAKLGQTLRLVGQSLFIAALLIGYLAILLGLKRAGRTGQSKEALWWMLATAPLMTLRSVFGLLSAATWTWSHYLPNNVSWHRDTADEQYGPNGFIQSKLLAEYLMAVTPEAIVLVFLLRTIWLITMPRHLYVPYSKRQKRLVGSEAEEEEMSRV